MVPKRVAAPGSGNRLTSNVQRLLPVLQQQRAPDVSEADTVTLVKRLSNSLAGLMANPYGTNLTQPLYLTCMRVVWGHVPTHERLTGFLS
jgi:hypothetical protein